MRDGLMFRPISFLLLLLVGAVPIASLRAAVITHGTFAGDTVTYQNVIESTAPSAPALFGMPTLVEDDTIVFMPTAFIATPTPTQMTSIVDSQVRFTMIAKPGEVIPQLLLEEWGTVTLDGPTTDFAYASVGMAIFYHVIEIDGVAIQGPSAMVNMEFTPGSPTGGTFFVSDGPLVNATWSGSKLLDFNQIILDDPNFTGHATKIEVTFDNTLNVGNFGSTQVLMQKNKLRISVPELPAGLLVLAGGLLLGARWLLRRSRFELK